MALLKVSPLGFPWKTEDPFLFCVYHDDSYPAAQKNMGPSRAALAGRRLGSDFGHPSGWSMYHGEEIPGFPKHPHRGFETVTIARHGLVDHCDSLGCAGRFGGGDVQWMTAGKGISHSEMFPLLDMQSPNRLELFQVSTRTPLQHPSGNLDEDIVVGPGAADVSAAQPSRCAPLQVWLNLPSADKMAEPHFAMLWAEDIPLQKVADAQVRG
ncbi:hypothetical protein CYMTET_20186 [Cymbomonas tetramitiformis]|uniref:Pirin N-terminal domain-containing protein n=1 Tax=Cymbomonas tetramitiformis TaxID=36881 RepID=A0AAE0G4K8_9CHLO|nr:hypothetical protein CYMTET_20186 [Cymbomonas tetramitiformis]